MNSQFNPKITFKLNAEQYKNISLNSSSAASNNGSSSIPDIYDSISVSNSSCSRVNSRLGSSPYGHADIPALHATPQSTIQEKEEKQPVFQSTRTSLLKKIKSKNLILGKELNKGSFGIVYEAELKSEDNNKIMQNTKVAVKITSKSKGRGSKEFKNEMKIAEYLQQPYVKHYPLVRTIGFTKNAMVMEYMVKGDVLTFFNQNRATSFNYTPSIMMDFLLAVDFMHFHNVIHRDIKVDNIMLDENMHAKLGDFGFSIIGSKAGNYLVGTPAYVAPELLLAEFENKQISYTFNSDMFAVGITSYVILTGKNAYPCMDSQQELAATLDENMRPVIPENLHSDLSFFVKKAWSANPHERPSSSQAVKMLETHYQGQYKNRYTI